MFFLRLSSAFLFFPSRGDGLRDADGRVRLSGQFVAEVGELLFAEPTSQLKLDGLAAQPTDCKPKLGCEVSKSARLKFIEM